MKKFYRQAGVVAAEAGFGVVLDGKPVRTPKNTALLTPSRALAEAIAAEWQAQSDDIKPDTLHLTRLAGTAIDLVAPRRPEVIAETAKYAETDLLCYRAPHPPELAARQALAWQPLLDWARQRYDAPLTVTTGLSPIAQPAAGLDALARAVGRHAAMELTALRLATSASGSLIIALALVETRLDAAAAFAAAELDENFQIERWGKDLEQAKRRANLKDDLALTARFVALLKE